ncbi:General negative regulator of transcription subunit 3 [Wickerhamomyces ciferrii]|uniref:General negative regulator of transcription subunit n=1 Tax=Wickerhamomyces ciferrii (strain ATCC 14091 / BCRC 22168 / CBS 111 / JCM 3599 / NBRC 0793 / NRRL Y-1031 F-60-10) TaxID=1206466 RepID=K0KXS8_WICCF|nr:General negative regulator of transcription subunit 3 [Wickerhamomyces ciferrii]CCH45873.1 General negative regulator of transcription subunit 3 [Wickerhamomyces ciferrii]
MSQRKLLQEIDKVFKKVKEGLEIFDGYYDKLQNCESQSQKEKIEGDLKREIKKLQRQRDQIKNWLSGNDVKDKNNLLENRRLIENAMERFKTVEKDMKTKAFSKEGLSMQRIDPKEKEKNEQADFIHSQLEELQLQSEKHEATIDQIHNSVKKGKKLDNSKQQEIESLNELISRNKWHSEKMELILRLLENDDIESEQVATLQEDIKYYVENNEDVDFIEDEGIYDELGLEDIEDIYGHIGDYPHAEDVDHDHGSSPIQQHHTPQKKSSISAQPSAPSTANTTTTTNNNHNNNHNTNNSHGLPASQSTAAPSTNLHNNGPIKPPGLSNTNINVPSPRSTTPGLISLKPSVAPVKTDLKYSSVLSAGVNSNNNTPTNPSANIASTTSTTASPSTNTNNINTPPASKINLNTSNTATTPSQAPPGLSKTNTNITNDSREGTQSPILIPNGFQDLLSSFEKTKNLIINPVPFQKISKILETSLLNCPDSLDSDKPKNYIPNNPHPTSIYYPQEPLAELNYSIIVKKLDESTLFYNFYFDQGKYIQIQNAQELVKRGWIFNKINKKWWKKFEDIQPPPTPLSNGNSNQESSQAEKKFFWKYFDYEDTWLSRRKDDFKPNSEELVTEF